MPAGVVTVMLTLPLPGGLAAVICVPESVPIVPAAPPKLTPVAPARPVPPIVTAVPPLGIPESGETLMTNGDLGGGGAV